MRSHHSESRNTSAGLTEKKTKKRGILEGKIHPNFFPFKGSLLPETILSVKGSDSLPAPKSSLAFVSSVGSPGLVWDLLSSLNVLFLMGIKLVASFSSDSAQEIHIFNFIV